LAQRGNLLPREHDADATWRSRGDLTGFETCEVFSIPQGLHKKISALRQHLTGLAEFNTR
jgi:hypothetical protein